MILIGGYGLFRYFIKNTTSNEVNHIKTFTKSSTISDVMNNASFVGFGNLIFPVDRPMDGDTRLDDIDDIYIWYNYIDDDTTVDIVNSLKEDADSGNQVFYPIYTEEEMRQNPEKRNTGLFFFRGEENAKTAVVNAGGGFMYVGAMQDSFPHALALSKLVYNAFALIYRSGTDTAMEDLKKFFIRDFYTSQLDRSGNNFLFQQTPSGIRLAPLYDYENSFETSYVDVYRNQIAEINLQNPETLMILKKDSKFQELLHLLMQSDMSSFLNEVEERHQIRIPSEYKTDYRSHTSEVKKLIVEKKLL